MYGYNALNDALFELAKIRQITAEWMLLYNHALPSGELNDMTPLESLNESLVRTNSCDKTGMFKGGLFNKLIG